MNKNSMKKPLISEKHRSVISFVGMFLFYRLTGLLLISLGLLKPAWNWIKKGWI